MKIFIPLVLALVVCCEAQQSHKRLTSLIKVCELQNFCNDHRYGPWIIEKGNRGSCNEFQGLKKREVFAGLDRYQCNNVRVAILALILII